VALTLICVLIAWVFFRAKTFAAASAMLASLFSQPPGTRISPSDGSLVPWLVALGAVVLLLPNSQRMIDQQLRPRLAQLRSWARAHELFAFLAGTEVVVIVLLALIAARRDSTEFIYFNF
jgi:hypothetical protein